MHNAPVLMLTRDDALWDHWKKVSAHHWKPVHRQSLEDLNLWRKDGQQLVLLDAGLPDLPAWDDPVWTENFADLCVIVGTMHTLDEEAKEILAAGARGYVHAYSPVSALNTVLKTVQGGGVWMGPTLLARLLRDLDARLPEATDSDWATPLSAREKDVAQRAALGHSNQAIADSLHITERTVRAHMSSIFNKLDVQDRLALALKVHGIQV